MTSMTERLWWLTERLKKFFFCAFFHRRDRCYPDVGGRGLAGRWHCDRCRPCSEGLDVALAGEKGIVLKGWLWNQRVMIRPQARDKA
jgi:hypothetical protein